LKIAPLPVDIEKACRRVLADWDLDDLADPVIAATQPTLLCEWKSHAPRVAAPIGSTKLGGFPDLPDHVEWPQFNGRYLPFIAQVNLAELPVLEGGPLPTTGRLYYFYWCTNERCETPVTVLWLSDDTTDLVRREVPCDQILVDWHGEALYEEDTATRFATGITVSVPLAEQLATECGLGEIGLNDRWEMFADEYAQEVSLRLEYGLDFWDRIGDDEGIEIEHMRLIELLGYPDPSGYFLYPLQAVRGGHTDGKEFWQSILSIDSQNNMLWSDEGSLAFFVPDSDLRRGNLSRVQAQVMSS
jgi:uncharacterized protein YwqG